MNIEDIICRQAQWSLATHGALVNQSELICRAEMTPNRAMLHDETAYPNPDVFDPTRYLTPERKTNKNAPDPTEAAFGFGRRICPGRHLAMESMWITMSYILATLNIEKAKDAFGKFIEPSGECTAGLMRYVCGCPCYRKSVITIDACQLSCTLQGLIFATL